MPYWLDWIMRDTQFPLPDNIRALLATEKEIHAALSAGGDPIELSIEKWRRIGEALAEIGSMPMPLAYMRDLARHIGYRTCALCIQSIARYETSCGKIRYSTDKCKVCSLSALDRCTRDGSVYQRFEKLLLESPLDVSPSAEASRMREISSLRRQMEENLRSLVSGGETSR